MDEPSAASHSVPPDSATAHTRHRFDRMAPVYDLLEWPFERAFLQDWRADLWAQVDGPDVLEIGVGTGRNVPYYPPHVKVTAVDLSSGMLTCAQAVAQDRAQTDVTFRETDAQALPYPDDRFDEVVATFAFCSVPDPVQGLREALRVTRPGGHLYLLEHMRAAVPGLAHVMDWVDFPIHWLTGVHVARTTMKDLAQTEWRLQSSDALASAGIFRRVQAQAPLK